MSRREEEYFHSHLDIPNTIQWCKDINISFTENKTDFINFSDKYNDPYGDNLLAKITAAGNVPSDEKVVDVIEGLTAAVETSMETARIELQKLFNFVGYAFPKDSAKLFEAGKNFYEEARKVPSRMILLLGAAKDFADTYAVRLADKGYSAAMAAVIVGAKTALNDAVNAQSKAKRERPSKTRHRRMLINDMYDTVRDLCEDAKIIYVRDYAKYNLYLIPGIDRGSSMKGPVGKGATAHVMKRSFQPTDELKLASTGTTDLMFCITTDEATACASGVQVNAGTSSTVSASALGDPSNMYLNVTNLSPDTEGSYKVTIV